MLTRFRYTATVAIAGDDELHTLTGTVLATTYTDASDLAFDKAMMRSDSITDVIDLEVWEDDNA